MTYGDVLAKNVRAARSRAGLSQQLLAARMRALGYGEWHHTTVGRVENGKRRATAEEIHALAWALQTNLLALMNPTADDESIEFPNGHAIGVASVRRSFGGLNDRAVTWINGGDGPTFHVLSATETNLPRPGESEA